MGTPVEFLMNEPNLVTGEKIWLSYELSNGLLVAKHAFMCIRYDMVVGEETTEMGRRILLIEPGIMAHWGLENHHEKFAWIVARVEDGTKTADEILSLFPNPPMDINDVVQGLWTRGL